MGIFNRTLYNKLIVQNLVENPHKGQMKRANECQGKISKSFGSFIYLFVVFHLYQQWVFARKWSAIIYDILIPRLLFTLLLHFCHSIISISLTEENLFSENLCSKPALN